jgi:hypothetical protein
MTEKLKLHNWQNINIPQYLHIMPVTLDMLENGGFIDSRIFYLKGESTKEKKELRPILFDKEFVKKKLEKVLSDLFSSQDYLELVVDHIINLALGIDNLTDEIQDAIDNDGDSKEIFLIEFISEFAKDSHPTSRDWKKFNQFVELLKKEGYEL